MSHHLRAIGECLLIYAGIAAAIWVIVAAITTNI